MRKSAAILLILIIVFSCKKDEIASTAPQLKNCRVEYLYFLDDIILKSGQSLCLLPEDTLFTGCSYSYANHLLTRVTGGFVAVPSGSNFSNLCFTKDAYDSISSVDNRIYVYTKFKIGGSIHEDINNPTVYYLDSQQRLIKINKRDAWHPNGYDLNYTYSDNMVFEIGNNGLTRRKFYFENNNLVKVDYEMTDQLGAVFWKKEILFQEFDNMPNPFKNMFFVKGAFFRAFSENNYKSHTTNEYSRSSDGTLVPTWYSWFTMPILYNAEGFPMFGDYE